MGDTKTYRFREHTMQPDPVGEPVLYAMSCKTRGCEAHSEVTDDPAKGSEWAADHFKANPDHTGYREVIQRGYRFWPGAWQ